jgi:predicted transglutaminase-like cysteine proteinase
MVRLRISAALGQSFRVLVMFPCIISGLAIMCAAVPSICLSSPTVLSLALKVSDHHHAQSHLLHGQPLLRSDPQIGVPAGVGRVPDGLQQDIQIIRFDVPTLAPMAFTQFCLKYPSDCKPQRLLFGDVRVELNKMRWSELENINRNVNSSIRPERNEDGLAGEKWLLSPVRGDCNDYAVTKRHQLITRGWPARTVLLSEVVTVSGEHHLVTVIRTDSGDLVLDNLTDQIKPWSRTPYRWLRIQTPKNPNYWASISERNA